MSTEEIATASGRWSRRWRPGVRASLGILAGFVALVLVATGLVRDWWLGALDWTSQDDNAGAVQAITAVVSLAATLVLLFVTGRAMRAQELEATESARQTQIAIDQLRLAQRQIILFSLGSMSRDADAGGFLRLTFDVVATNDGPGTAIAVPSERGGDRTAGHGEGASRRDGPAARRDLGNGGHR